MVAAEINDEIKPSEIFADAYKNQHSSSRKLNFYFEVNKIVRKSYYINHNKRWDDKYSINVIKRSYYFIYNDNNIYMSHNQYSPLSYNEHFTSNIKI